MYRFGSISFFQNGLACNVVEEIDSYCLNLSIQITSTADTDMSVNIVTKEQRMQIVLFSYEKYSNLNVASQTGTISSEGCVTDPCISTKESMKKHTKLSLKMSTMARIPDIL